MLDQLFNTVKGAVSEKLVSDIGLPPNKLDDTMEVGKESVASGLGSAISNGNISGILDLFKGNTAPSQSPIVSMIQGQFTSLMVSKLNVERGTAVAVGNFLIPFVMEKLAGKAQKEGVDNEQGVAKMLSSDLGGDLLGNLLKGGNLGSALGGLFK